jgi:hypothetical protein
MSGWANLMTNIPGYSGGGMFNSKGEIVGIICQRIVRTDGSSFNRVNSINVLKTLLTIDGLK